MVDYDTYKNECLLVSKDSELFDNFKRNIKITYMLEQTEPITTAEYFTKCFTDELVNRHKKIFHLLPWEKLLINDTVGNPLLFPTPQLEPYVKYSSHTTIRYILYALNICEFLESVNHEGKLNILEIGGSYGGQIFILSTILEFKNIESNYTLIDLPHVLELAKTYLSHEKIKYSDKISCLTMEEALNNSYNSYNLVLSFYSLGEMPLEYQNIYIENFISKSKYGYIIWNDRFVNKKITDANKIDVNKVEPVFSQYITLLTWPSIKKFTVKNDIITQSPFAKEWVNIYEKSFFQDLNNIVINSGELPEESILNDHLQISHNLNMRQVDLYSLSRLSSKILNIGFNTGYSTLIMLESNPDCKVVCVDNCIHSYTKECFDYISKKFPNRLTLVEGDSKDVVNESLCGNDFDMVNINGSQNHNMLNLDFFNSKSICKKDAYIIWNNRLHYSLSLWNNYLSSGNVKEFTLLSNEHNLGRIIKE